MTVLRARKVSCSLTSKGFRRDDRDHRYFNLYVDEVQQGIWTKVSHASRGELTEFHIHAMADQLKLTKREFLDLANCPLKYEGYLKILVAQGIKFKE